MEEGERMIRCEGKTVFPWNLVLFKFLYLSPQSNLSQFPESTRATPNIFQLVGSRSCSWVFGCVPVPTAARAKKARTIKTANPPLASPSFKPILPPVTAARLPFHPPPFPRLLTSSHQPSPPGDPFHPTDLPRFFNGGPLFQQPSPTLLPPSPLPGYRVLKRERRSSLHFSFSHWSLGGIVSGWMKSMQRSWQLRQPWFSGSHPLPFFSLFFFALFYVETHEEINISYGCVLEEGCSRWWMRLFLVEMG